MCQYVISYDFFDMVSHKYGQTLLTVKNFFCIFGGYAEGFSDFSPYAELFSWFESVTKWVQSVV